ncbi:MAG: hypothetical protein LUH19_10040 [Lachnospiraceae bacterium]|nr:hypothetical protein [Lachnospiraceae bacterium]
MRNMSNANFKFKSVSGADLVEYWRGNEEFADLFNSSLYYGLYGIDPETLRDDDLDFAKAFPDDLYAGNIVAKVSDQTKGYFMILSIDANYPTNHAIVENSLKYEAAAYEKQIKGPGDVYPVDMIVFYAGKERWEGPKALPVGHNRKPYLKEQKLNVIEARVDNLPFENENNKRLIQWIREE